MLGAKTTPHLPSTLIKPARPLVSLPSAAVNSVAGRVATSCVLLMAAAARGMMSCGPWCSNRKCEGSTPAQRCQTPPWCCKNDTRSSCHVTVGAASPSLFSLTDTSCTNRNRRFVSGCRCNTNGRNYSALGAENNHYTHDPESFCRPRRSREHWDGCHVHCAWLQVAFPRCIESLANPIHRNHNHRTSSCGSKRTPSEERSIAAPKNLHTTLEVPS